jgi:hypothetical protein
MTDPFVVWQHRGRGHAGPATDSTAGHAKGFSGRSAKTVNAEPWSAATGSSEMNPPLSPATCAWLSLIVEV